MKLADTNSEFIRYSLLGVPTSFPCGDYDLDGDVDAADTTALGNFISCGSYGWNLDFNGGGNTDTGDTDDHAAYVSGYAQGLGGRTVLSRTCGTACWCFHHRVFPVAVRIATSADHQSGGYGHINVEMCLFARTLGRTT